MTDYEFITSLRERASKSDTGGLRLTKLERERLYKGGKQNIRLMNKDLVYLDKDSLGRMLTAYEVHLSRAVANKLLK